jgi:hypothetical protein
MKSGAEWIFGLSNLQTKKGIKAAEKQLMYITIKYDNTHQEVGVDLVNKK